MISTPTSGAAAVPDNKQFMIGKYYNQTTTEFKGKIDEVRISNTARNESWSDAEYYSLFNQLMSISQ